MTENSGNLTEFIFGNLSSPEGRLRRLKTTRLGLYHSPVLSPLAPGPGESIEITVSVGIDLAIASLNLYYTTDGSFPTIDNPGAQNITLEKSRLDWDTLEWSYLETWTAVIPGQPDGTLIQYIIIAITTVGEQVGCPYLDLKGIEELYSLEELDLTVLNRLSRQKEPQVYGFYIQSHSIPDWFREAIIYEIFVDRFASENELPHNLDLGQPHGGNIEGVISRLDYLTDLGINCIWLTPIFKSSSYHGYDPEDHRAIAPRYGDISSVRILLSEAHKRNIRVIFDFVANHFSDRHPAFIKATGDKKDRHNQWFRFTDWPDEYDCFFDVPSQPEINSDNPEVRKYLIDSARYWLKEGCDGFRLDYANGCTHAFWSAFHEELKEEKADSVIFGEVVESPTLLRSYTGRMEGCLDFRLLELMRGFFAFGTLRVSQFDRSLCQHLEYFQSTLLLPSFLDNHDMNRFLWIVGGDKRRLKLAALCQFTLPYPPIIYYGTEVGVNQRAGVGRLEEARPPQYWGEKQDRNLLEFYRGLIKLRKDNHSIWQLERDTFLIDDERALYGYTVGDYEIILNNSDRTHQISLPWGEFVLSTDSRVMMEIGGPIALPSYCGVIVKK